ncbi:alpha-1,2-fucosyltransferase [Pedobacter sp. V48]|uniref:alpha-1,2-fucosyltransferase n=1 Tax=Pedobacter sp. V48 TaxID=509635 RepID=UPI000A039E3F
MNISVSGYWQSPKYFSTIIPILYTDFTFRNKLTGKWRYMYEKIRNCTSIMINVRRGDFFEKPDYHGVVSIEYINNAIDTIRSRIYDPKFFIFSDDIPWCLNTCKWKKYFHQFLAKVLPHSYL